MIKSLKHTKKGKMSFSMASFEEILNDLKLRNSKRSANRKLLQSDKNVYFFLLRNNH